MMSLLLAAFLILPGSGAQQARQQETVTLSVEPPAVGVRAGSSARATVLVGVAKGWHINSASPADSELVATTLAATPPPGITVAGVRFPPAARKVFAFSSEPLEVYEGTVPVVLEFSAAEGTAPGEYAVPVDVSYQACNNDICLPPAAFRLVVTVRVISH